MVEKQENIKILFLNLPYRFAISRTSRWPEKTKSGTLYYPYWLCYAAGVCMERGYDVRVIDCIARKYSVADTVEAVKKYSPDYLVCEITTPVCTYDYETIARIRDKNAKVRIIAGGTHATAMPKEVLDLCQAVDVVARQEYDNTIDEIIRNWEDLSVVPGISFRGNDTVAVHNADRPWLMDMDSLPMVTKVYERFLDVNDYGYSLAETPMIQIFSARGCPFHCNFCTYPQTMSGRCYRVRSVSDFVDEMEYIAVHMPYIKEIFIEDDTFTINYKRVYDICAEIMNRRLKVRWSCNVRADLPEKLMRVMRKAGCRLLVAGFESGSQKVLDETKKGIKLEAASVFVKNAHRNRLKVFGCFMIGLKGDTLETIEETFRFAKKIYPDMVFFQQAVPFPGTELYDWAKEKGYLITEDYSEWLDENGSLRCLIDYPYASALEIEKIRDRMMSRYYFSLKYVVYTLLHNFSIAEWKRIGKGGFSYIKFRIQRFFSRNLL